MNRTEAFADILFAVDAIMRPGTDASPVIKAIHAYRDIVIAQTKEACAQACDAIADDKHAQYKGRPPHAPDNDHRADTYTEGEGSGAELCASALRVLP